MQLESVLHTDSGAKLPPPFALWTRLSVLLFFVFAFIGAILPNPVPVVNGKIAKKQAANAACFLLHNGDIPTDGLNGGQSASHRRVCHSISPDTDSAAT